MLQFTLGLIFALMAALGFELENFGAVTWRVVPAVLILTAGFSVGLKFLWRFLARAEISLRSAPESKFLREIFLRPNLVGIILLVCWTPCWLSIFPGNFVYDATKELAQAVNGYSGNFPRLHSVLIVALLGLSASISGACEAGVAIYIVVQMTCMAAMYARMLKFFTERGTNSWLLAAAFLYCAIFPVVPMLATTTVRDVLFSILLTWTAFLAYRLAVGERVEISFGIFLALTLISRSNNAGILPLIILLAFVIILRSKKFAAAAVGVFVSVNFLLAAICQPFTPANVEASLSVFAQGLARAYVMAPETFTEAEREKFAWYFGSAEIKYVPENADPVKARLDVHGDLAGFLKYWLEIGKKNPHCYAEAILANSWQMWYPPSVVDGYQRAGVKAYVSYCDKSYFAFGHAEPPVELENFLPRVKNFYERIGLFISFEKIPVLGLLFSIGFQFWFLLNCAFYAAWRRAKNLILPLAILLAYAILSAFVPLVLLRYFAALFFAFPLVLIFTLQPTEKFS